MVDIGLSGVAFALLMGVFFGGKKGRFENAMERCGGNPGVVDAGHAGVSFITITQVPGILQRAGAKALAANLPNERELGAGDGCQCFVVRFLGTEKARHGKALHRLR